MIEVIGLVGAALAGAAYVPQIWHLIHERCSAGLSRSAFTTWLVASGLITLSAVMTGTLVLIVLGTIQVTATTLIVVYTTRYAGSYCSTHRLCEH
jgi:uncharacterized protein with PQ loop repeat